MFFVKFIPTFPILHRATFVFRDSTHPLLLNAIAIGSLYLGPKASIIKGEALWKLAHTAVATSWQTLISHRGPHDACDGVQLVITALLSQVYGALSKNRSIRTTSQATRALSFSWARRCGMYDNNTSSDTQIVPSSASEAERDHQWRLWVGREIQQRALLAHVSLKTSFNACLEWAPLEKSHIHSYTHTHLYSYSYAYPHSHSCTSPSTHSFARSCTRFQTLYSRLYFFLYL